MPNLADQIREPGGPTSLTATAIPDGSVFERNGATFRGLSKVALSTALDVAFLTNVASAADATYTWTTAPNVEVTHAAAKCVITVPAATDTTSWAVGEARRLAVANVGGFGIGFAAVADVGFNYDAVNNAIVTLTGSNVTPAVGVNVPVYTVFRKAAASYLISVGW